MSSLHTIGAAKTIDMVIEIFKEEQQQQIRTQLSSVIQAIVSQQLIKRADGQGRVIATEIMITNPAIANLIRESKTHQIDMQIQTGRKQGMRLMDTSLFELYTKNVISKEMALAHASDTENFARIYLKESGETGSSMKTSSSSYY